MAYHDEQEALEGARKQWVLNTFGASLEELAKEGIMAHVVGDPRPPGGTAGLMAEIDGDEYGPLASLAELGAVLATISGEQLYPAGYGWGYEEGE